jgi:hypothetical protein
MFVSGANIRLPQLTQWAVANSSGIGTASLQ